MANSFDFTTGVFVYIPYSL